MVDVLEGGVRLEAVAEGAGAATDGSVDTSSAPLAILMCLDATLRTLAFVLVSHP